MNAIEARNMALKVNTDRNNVAYVKILTTIENAVKNGDYETIVYGSFKSDLIKQFEGMGYTVNYQSGGFRDESSLSIKW